MFPFTKYANICEKRTENEDYINICYICDSKQRATAKPAYIYSLLGSITWNKVHLWVHVWHAILHSDISTRKTINNLAVFSDDNNFITKAF